jgi:hypothetical protein
MTTPEMTKPYFAKFEQGYKSLQVLGVNVVAFRVKISVLAGAGWGSIISKS